MQIRILWILSSLLLPCYISAQDLALNKSYTLSIPPNYSHSALPSDKTSLTDGVYTKSNYWTNPTTVGWQGRGLKLTITIDLGEIEPVGAITFNTLRNINSDISFPQDIFVFVSNDNKNFLYAGDAADTTDNLPGSYELKKFILNGIDKSARYVLLVIIPQGFYLFCDEIEVLKGQAASTSKELIPKEYLKNAIDSVKALQFNRKNLRQLSEKLQDISKSGSGNGNKEFLDINAQLSNKKITENDLRGIKNRIGQERASDLRGRYKVPFIIEKCNPWDSLNEFHEPKENTGVLNFQFSIPKDGVQYGSFLLTNCNSSAQQFSFNVSNTNASLNNIELFSVPYVPSSNYTRIPDPCVALKNKVIINPGISEMFIFRVTGINNGTAKSLITIHSGNTEASVNIYTQVQNLVTQNNTDNLNTNVWAYLNYPMLKDRQEEAVRDLKLHHINTIVIPTGIIPGMETFDSTKLLNYLANFRRIKNILLFLNYGSPASRKSYKNEEFMSSEWKNKFVLWYQKITRLIHDNGFLNTQIYFYPYDEVGGHDIEDFKNLAIWVKKAIPDIRLFATLNNNAAIDSLLSLLDIAQIFRSNDKLKELPPHKCQVWIYSATITSRSLSPYGFYRLMSWDAFVKDFKGIGFWNYADEGADKQLNLITDPMPDLATDYSVIYDGPGKEIISSRRWEAFRLGIEDYSILKLYAQKFGIEKAKALAKDVISSSEDLNKADNVINNMIAALAGK